MLSKQSSRGWGIHDLHHGAAWLMINSVIDLIAVGKMRGRASVQSTERYSHLAN